MYILQLHFSVENKKKHFTATRRGACKAINELKPNPEIAIQGLGEISPDEFKNFIGEDIRLDPVMLDKEMSIESLLQFYMGKNTPNRQEFIINNLKVELDIVDSK